MISLARQFLFVHVPKTAGNAIQNKLRAYSEDVVVVTEDGCKVLSGAVPKERREVERLVLENGVIDLMLERDD